MTIQATDGGGRFYSKADYARVNIFVDGGKEIVLVFLH